MQRRASFSQCKTFRYQLIRTWNESLPAVCFIGLNPSTADHRIDDPTIRRCIGFAKSWGYGSLTIVNLFAYRTPYPEALKQADDPIGPRNRHFIRQAVKGADVVVAIWGNDGAFMGQAEAVSRWVGPLHAIKVNQSGHPAHPLYLKKGLPFIEYVPAL